MQTPNRTAAWSTRYGFYLVTIASAFSLGNLWRFPFVVEANGGSAFVLIYIFCALVIGLPVVIAEIMLGKAYKQSVVGAMDQLTKESMVAPRLLKRTHLWVFVGKLANYASVMLLAYYAVICGWVLYYLGYYLIGFLNNNIISSDEAFSVLSNSGIIQVCITALHLLITGYIVSKGLRVGLEKSLGWIMPLFLFLIILLVVKSLSMDTAVSSIRYLFYPNFSDISSGTLIQVIGHVFFTLSIGMGTIAAFGSYLRDDSIVSHVSSRMVLLDTAVSLFVALLIFPIYFSASKFANTGPSLMFYALPELFRKFEWDRLVGFLFFGCLYIAALASSIGLLEASVSNLLDRHNFTRSRATKLMGLIAFLIAIIPALSSSMFSNYKFLNMSALVLFDHVTVNWILPLVAFGISVAVGFGMKKELKQRLLINKEELETTTIYRDWQFLIRWIVPLFILTALILNIVGMLKN